MDEHNNRIAIMDLIQDTLKGVEQLEGGVVIGQSLQTNPPKEWTANIVLLADPCDEYVNDTGNDAGWDGHGRNSPVPVLELNTLTLQIELCRADTGRLREMARIEGDIVRALHAADWRSVCHRSKRDGTAWSYPEPGSSTSFTFCAIQWVVEWFSGRGDLVHQPV